MINIYEVAETNQMIEQENLDVRTITLGISLLDCIDSDLDALNKKIYDKITGREEKDKKIEKDAKELETKNPFAESKKAAIASDIKTIEEREAKSKEAQNAKYAKLDQIRQIERIANKS